MELQINKDPQDIGRSVFSGKKMWQYLCIAAAFVIAIVFSVLTVTILNNTVTGIICVFLALPFGYIGLYNRCGLDFFSYRKKKKLEKNAFLFIREPYVPDIKKNKNKGGKNGQVDQI